MDREELLKLFEKIDCRDLVIPSIDEAIYLFNKISEYKEVLNEPITSSNKEKYNFYHSLYIKDLQQYNNIIKTLCSLLIKNDIAENDSPLRDFYKKFKGGIK